MRNVREPAPQRGGEPTAMAPASASHIRTSSGAHRASCADPGRAPSYYAFASRAEPLDRGLGRRSSSQPCCLVLRAHFPDMSLLLGQRSNAAEREESAEREVPRAPRRIGNRRVRALNPAPDVPQYFLRVSCVCHARKPCTTMRLRREIETHRPGSISAPSMSRRVSQLNLNRAGRGHSSVIEEAGAPPGAVPATARSAGRRPGEPQGNGNW